MGTANARLKVGVHLLTAGGASPVDETCVGLEPREPGAESLLVAVGKEHKAVCRLGAFERSAVVEHTWQEGHEIDWKDMEIIDTARDLQERKVKESLHPNGSQDLLDEQRWREKISVTMAKDHQEHWEERETKTSSSTNSEIKRQLTATRSDSALSPLGSSPTRASSTGDAPTSSLETYAHSPSDERRPRPQEHRTRPLPNWLFKNSSQVDIVDLHSCPDDDHSMAIEIVGIKFHC